jgi:hypothetical protein
VLGVRADDPHDPLAADDLAVLANAPDAASHFHGCSFAAGPKTGESSFISQIRLQLKAGSGKTILG